jgi:MarR family 2-MHQ and catechol resistance regulon transcriptional repressor
MSLKDELKLKKGFATVEHEALLNIYYTSTCIKKRAKEALRKFRLTDVQLNLMMLLHHQGGGEGLTQAQLSEMMLVNRANITSLIDRMERDGIVRRTSGEDRRYNIIRLTGKGRKKLKKVEPLYAKEVKRIMSAVSAVEKKQIIKMLEKVRKNLE